jgi:hypothetical protein
LSAFALSTDPGRAADRSCERRALLRCEYDLAARVILRAAGECLGEAGERGLRECSYGIDR